MAVDSTTRPGRSRKALARPHGANPTACLTLFGWIHPAGLHVLSMLRQSVAVESEKAVVRAIGYACGETLMS